MYTRYKNIDSFAFTDMIRCKMKKKSSPGQGSGRRILVGPSQLRTYCYTGSPILYLYRLSALWYWFGYLLELVWSFTDRIGLIMENYIAL